MKLIEVLSLLVSVNAAPFLFDILSPKMTSVQNIKSPDYRGMVPPPWITGSWGSSYGPYGGYGSNNVAPPPPQLNLGQSIPPNNDLGQQSNGSNPAASGAGSQPNQIGAVSPVGTQGTLPASGSNSNGLESPVNDSATYDNSTPPPTFQFNP